MQIRPLRTVALTSLAMLGFAANSVLCRLALAEGAIDPVAFTVVRLASGALMLAVVASIGGVLRPDRAHGASWTSAIALFAYAATFSFAYMRVHAGVGALILFGLVQLTMVGWGVAHGERLSARRWFGFVLAIGGLVGLTAPGLTAPDPVGAVLMALAGIAWGAYSIRGRRARSAVAASAGNFARSVPFAGLLAFGGLLAPGILGHYHLSTVGILLALASGALASGLAYSIWYAALRDLQSTQAAIVQLVVPVLAAIGGVVLIAEPLTPRLLLAGCAILAGIAVALRT